MKSTLISFIKKNIIALNNVNNLIIDKLLYNSIKMIK